MDDRDLMGLRADVLFRYDARGRMVCANDPQGGPAPRLFLGCTSDGQVVRFGQAVSDDVLRRLTASIERHQAVSWLRVPPALLAAVREVLGQHAPVAREGGGPAFRFPASITRSGEVVQVTDANLAVVRETYPWLYTELALWQPCFAALRDGAVVSVCFSSRLGAAVAEAGVETLPAFRGRGYAAAVAAAWGAAIRESGRIPLYSTAWDNVASQGVARRLGLIMFGADATWA